MRDVRGNLALKEEVALIDNPRSFLLGNFMAAVSAVTPLHVLPSYIPEFPVKGRVIVLALGKAAEEMALVALGTLQNRHGFDVTRFSALAVIRKGDRLSQTSEMIDVIEAAHPRPDETSMEAAEALLKRASFASEDDLVLCLISGGGSSLTMCPAEGLTWQNLQDANDALLKGGVPIDKMNTLRKHLSRFSGGYLRMAVKGARVVTLAISDVPGDALPVIASGPTVFDNSTFEDALNVVRDYKLEVPAEVLAHLERGARGEIEDTLKESNPLIKNDVAKVIASSTVACAAGEKHAKNVGFSTIMQGIVEGEAHEVAARMAAEISAFAKTCKEPTVFISGGELTVTLPKNNVGNGGRNSRFMLALLKALQGAKGIHAIACGTDGIDYTTYAGAVIGDDTWNAAQKKNLSADDYLTRFDSHCFFEQIDGLIKTNATHTNVGDYRAILVLPKEG